MQARPPTKHLANISEPAIDEGSMPRPTISKHIGSHPRTPSTADDAEFWAPSASLFARSRIKTYQSLQPDICPLRRDPSPIVSTQYIAIAAAPSRWSPGALLSTGRPSLSASWRRCWRRRWRLMAAPQSRRLLALLLRFHGACDCGQPSCYEHRRHCRGTLSTSLWLTPCLLSRLGAIA